MTEGSGDPFIDGIQMPETTSWQTNVRGKMIYLILDGLHFYAEPFSQFALADEFVEGAVSHCLEVESSRFFFRRVSTYKFILMSCVAASTLSHRRSSYGMRNKMLLVVSVTFISAW